MTRVLRFSLPVLVLATAAALSVLALPRLGSGPDSQVVAGALALDLTVVVPALVYFLFIRTKRLPWIAIVPAFVASYGLAVATLPESDWGVLDAIRLLLVPAELAAVGYLVVLARRTVRGAANGEGDFATRFRAAARTVIGSRVPADILTTEVAILHHAFRRRKSPAPRAGSFTVHREVGYLPVLVGLLVVLVVETVAVHALLRRWSATAAWVLTALSLYAIVWLVGDYRALGARPTRVTPTHLALRLGLRWEADLPIDRIAEVDRPQFHREQRGRETLVAALLGQPNLRLRLTEPVEMTGMYGLRKTVREIWLRVDRVAEFCTALRQVRRGPGRVAAGWQGD